MNFLALRRTSPWIFLLATAGCGATPPSDVDLSDAGSRAADVTAAHDVAAATAPDRVAPTPCAATGTGRLRVSLGLDPGLTVRAPEVWLMVHCAGGVGFERVLRWDRNATQVLDALAPGVYEVRGSSFVAPWSSSTRVMLVDGATAAISLTLPPAPAPLAQLRSESGVVAGPVWRGSVPFTSVGNTGAVASLEVEARPYVSDPPAASDAGFLSVTAVAHNPCATGTCAPYVLRALEIRTRTDGEPTGLSGYAFPQGERLDPGENKSVPQPMVVRGSMPDATHGIELVLYGEVMRSDSARY